MSTAATFHLLHRPDPIDWKRERALTRDIIDRHPNEFFLAAKWCYPDLVGEVYLACCRWALLRGWDPQKGPLIAFVFGLCRKNRLLRHDIAATKRDDNPRSTITIADIELTGKELEPPAMAANREAIARLLDAVDALPPKLQHVVRECYLNEKKTQEVARELGCSNQYVHTQLQQAFLLMGRQLDARGML